jgi:hypothetical protein
VRKEALLAIIGISLFMLVGASVWEGAAEFSSDLPETGLYIATNSLPINTVVDVTNLENGQFAQLVVSMGLNTSGYLALLSKDAADALGIEIGSLSRIRLSQDPDPLAYSRFIADPGTRTEYENFTLIPDNPRPPEVTPLLDPSQFVPSYTPPPQEPLQPQPQPQSQPQPPPQEPPQPQPPPPQEIPQLQSQPQPQLQIETSHLIEPIELVRATPVAPVISTSGFSVPVIYAMEKGMYYVQVAAYSNPESVEYEISRKIDKSLPMAVMKIGSADRPIYRVLIGPVSFAESSAIMDRYKNLYPGIFVWQGK